MKTSNVHHNRPDNHQRNNNDHTPSHHLSRPGFRGLRCGPQGRRLCADNFFLFLGFDTKGLQGRTQSHDITVGQLKLTQVAVLEPQQIGDIEQVVLTKNLQVLP
jgi:hypothetical protein